MATTARPRVRVDMDQDRRSTNTASSGPVALRQTDDPAGKTENDWLTAEQRASLEAKLFDLGTTKYGLDKATARFWAQTFCGEEEGGVDTRQR
jgi:hypothetical protein